MNQQHQEYMTRYASSSKCLKGKNTRKSLTQCVELCADDRTHSVATKKNGNENACFVEQRDIITNTATNYTKGEAPASSVAGAEQSQCEYAAYEEAKNSPMMNCSCISKINSFPNIKYYQ